MIPKRSINALRIEFLLVALSFLTWVPRIPQIKDALELSNGQLGRILMVSGVSGIFFSKTSGRLVVKYGSKKMAYVVIPTMLTSSFLVGLCINQWVMMGAIVIGSFGGLLIFTSITTQANTMSSVLGTNTLNNLTAVSNIGSLLAVLIGSAFLTSVSTLTYLIVMPILIAIGFLICHPMLLDYDIHDENEDVDHSRKLPWFSKEVVPLYILALAMLSSTIAEFSANDWSALYARDQLHVPAPLYMAPFIFFQLAIVVTRFAGNRIGKRFGVARYVRVINLIAAAVWASCIVVSYALATSAHNYVGSLAIATVGFTAAGIGVAPNYPELMNVVGLPGYPKPIVIARLMSLVTGAFSFGPGIMGGLAELIGLNNALLLPPALLLVVSYVGGRALRA